LSDFGIAKNISSDGDLTRTGMFVGSPNYMAPEQAESGVIDRRADIYSLGVIFYEMLTGQKPYISDSVIDVIYKHKKSPVPKLPAGLEDYQDLLNLMMAKNRNDRFRDADSLLHYIRALRHRGMVRSMAELAKEPDFDVTGERGVPAAGRVTRVALQAPKRSVKRFVLMGLLALSICAYGGLLVFERHMAASETPRIAQAADPSRLALAEPEFADPVTTGPPAENAPAAAEVAVALAWLGRHSLDEYRLITPAKDNAYYYFSRLRHMDPDNEDAKEGLLAIAARYAILAETEIANDDYERARGYIAIGLQIDPHNEALAVLRDLAARPENGFFRTLARLFGS
jgi:serine/threonine-protein kinase PpkA